MMCGFFSSVPVTNAVPARAVNEHREIEEPGCEIFTGYWSDISNADDDDEVLPEGTGDDGHEGDDEQEDEVERLTNRMSPTAVNSMSMMPSHWPDVACQKFPIRAPPPLKRRRLEVPVRVVRKEAWEAQEKKLWEAYNDIQKRIESARPKFVRGVNSLQAYRACAIQSYLHLVLDNKRKPIDPSKRAAESQGFAENWGG